MTIADLILKALDKCLETEKTRLEKIRLKEVEVRVVGLLDYWGCLLK